VRGPFWAAARDSGAGRVRGRRTAGVGWGGRPSCGRTCARAPRGALAPCPCSRGDLRASPLPACAPPCAPWPAPRRHGLDLCVPLRRRVRAARGRGGVGRPGLGRRALLQLLQPHPGPPAPPACGARRRARRRRRSAPGGPDAELTPRARVLPPPCSASLLGRNAERPRPCVPPRAPKRRSCEPGPRPTPSYLPSKLLPFAAPARWGKPRPTPLQAPSARAGTVGRLSVTSRGASRRGRVGLHVLCLAVSLAASIAVHAWCAAGRCCGVVEVVSHRLACACAWVVTKLAGQQRASRVGGRQRACAWAG
jgi:hypothetical protein